MPKKKVVSESIVACPSCGCTSFTCFASTQISSKVDKNGVLHLLEEEAGPIELITCNKCGNDYIPSNFYDIV